jgi:hypothetical protein
MEFHLGDMPELDKPAFAFIFGPPLERLSNSKNLKAILPCGLGFRLNSHRY